MCALLLADGLVDPTFFDRIRLAVGPRVMHEIVHVLADKVIDRAEAEEPGTRRVGKRTVALEIDPVDSLARGIQQQASELAAIDDPARCQL